MARPRKSLICLQDTPYYHCVSRCVRRAFLCGKDHYSGKSYEHRRGWVENRLLALANAFAINVCAYAIMSNHSHVVLHVDREEALSWSTEEVLRRWHSLHNGTELTRQYMNPDLRGLLSKAQLQTVESSTSIYRHRLYDISWFMRLLNEFIAREANKEDDCTGRFWEGRFKSQALLDEAALAACMAYVDLNPIRAGLANTPENSLFTSISQRIAAAKVGKQPHFLSPFVGSGTFIDKNSYHGIPFNLKDYIELVELTGKQVLAEKTQSIENYSPILVRTGLQDVDWDFMVKGIENRFSTAISLSIATHKLSKRAVA